LNRPVTLETGIWIANADNKSKRREGMKIKQSVGVISVLGVTFGFFNQANAELFDRGGGLIYDDALDVTWLQDANYAQTSGHDADGRMTALEAKTWAENLTYYDSVRGVTYDDWRLPNATDVGNDGATYTNYYQGVDYGFNITAHSELSFMFYENLGNTAAYTASGFNTGCDSAAPDYCLTYTGPFINLIPSRYWTNQQYGSAPAQSFIFYFHLGNQQYTDNGNSEYAWAVRDGDVLDPVITVAVDIKPGSDPNCFRLNGNGVIPVAVLGSPDFDVSLVDTDPFSSAPLSFNGLKVRVRGKKGPLCSQEEVNGDVYTDLVCHFEDDPNEWLEGEDQTAMLLGTLLDGTQIEGADSICIVP
jgi:hypothetical protein